MFRLSKFFSFWSSFLFLLGAFVLYGCSNWSSSTGPSQTAQIAMRFLPPPRMLAAESVESITQITITVSSSDIQTITEIVDLPTFPLQKSITVAAGNNRKIDVSALSSLDNTYTGTETVNLTAGETRQVTITLTLNNAPVISSITLSSTTIAVASGTITMTCNASDADNDALTYTWATTDGTLSTTTANPTTLSNTTAASGTITVTCVVSDGKGGSDSEPASITATASGAVSMPFGF